MAKVRWDGKEFDAAPIKDNGDGTWMMRAMSHGPRFAAGSEIKVATSEVTNWDTPAVPPAQDAGQAQLEAAMAEERKTLPSVMEVIKNNPPIAHDAPDMPDLTSGVSVPDHPTHAPASTGSQSKETSTRPNPKHADLSEALAGMLGRVELAADRLHARIASVGVTSVSVMDKIGAVVDQVEATTNAIDDMAKKSRQG